MLFKKTTPKKKKKETPLFATKVLTGAPVLTCPGPACCSDPPYPRCISSFSNLSPADSSSFAFIFGTSVLWPLGHSISPTSVTHNLPFGIISIKTCSAAKTSNCGCLNIYNIYIFNISISAITQLLSTSDHLITKLNAFPSVLSLFALFYLKLLTIFRLVHFFLL